jgi:hypothetical protein
MSYRDRFMALQMDEYANRISAADDSAHETPMVDPRQNMDFQAGTSTDQLRLALNTLEVELKALDGVVTSPEDSAKAKDAIQVLKSVVKHIETKLAGYAAQNREKPRSDR